MKASGARIKSKENSKLCRAPEFFAFGLVGKKSDIYSFGIVACELLFDIKAELNELRLLSY